MPTPQTRRRFLTTLSFAGAASLITGNAAFVRKNPVVTKRVLRAILKAADLCVTEPALIARRIGFADNYDSALQTLRTIPYDKWREYDPEDTVRFYAL